MPELLPLAPWDTPRPWDWLEPEMPHEDWITAYLALANADATPDGTISEAADEAAQALLVQQVRADARAAARVAGLVMTLDYTLSEIERIPREHWPRGMVTTVREGRSYLRKCKVASFRRWIRTINEEATGA